MDNSSSHEIEQANEKDSRQLIVKLFQVLSEGGIPILDEHAELVSHQRRFPTTNPDRSYETQGDSQDKSSCSISGANHNKKMNILHIAGDYVNRKGILGQTSLHLSAKIRDTVLVDVFLNAGANVNAADMHKQTPLHLSARNGHEDVVETLLQAEANVEAEDATKQTPLHCSALNGHKDVVEILIKAGANVIAEDFNERTPLHLSAKNGHKDVVEALLKAGANVEVNNNKKQTSLHLSAESGHKEVVETLLKAKANADAKDINKLTPLHYSAWNGHKEVVETLFNAGANLAAEDVNKQTPLHLSSTNGHKEVVETLLKAEVNVEAEDKLKQTPLHLSAKNGHKEVVDILITAGANVIAEDLNKRRPLHLSAKNGHKEVVEILLKAGANVDTKNMAKQTPLHYSVYFKHDDVTELLLRACAAVNVRDIRGRTCLDYMDDRQRLRFRIKPRKLFKLRNWMYSLTNSKKHVQRPTSTKTTTEHTETISATFTDLNSGTFPCQDIRTIQNEESSSNNGQDETSRDMSTLPSPELSLERSAGTPSDPQSLCSPSSPSESQGPNYKDLQEMSNIRQQVENHWAKFSPETTEGCETSCSHDVKAAFQAGRIMIPTTINITQNKITQNIKKVKRIRKVKHYYEPGTSFNIHQAENVALGDQTVVHPIRTVLVDDDVDGSSSEEESDNKF